ncbi:MAG: AAA family ATPase [Pseudomonadota bacterium]
MAIMRPVLTEDQLRALPSQAEARFYRACRDHLPNDVLVVHSASWAYRDKLHQLREGEADFTLALPTAGLLTVEVKGGGISLDARTGEWSSIDRFGVAHAIKDPFRQAQSEKFAILDQIKGHPKWRRWPGRRVISGHAVFFPDLHDVTALAHPGRARELIGGQADLQQLQAWTTQACAFWRTGQEQDLGNRGVDLVEEILCGPVEVRALLRAELAYAEAELVRLTERQARVLRTLGGRKRAVIAGGAGTGKTLIAVEKARQLAAEGQKVLLLCYNRPLADVLAHSLANTAGLAVMSYHQLCEERIDRVRKRTGRDVLEEAASSYPGRGDRQKYEVQMPFALALANEVLTDDLFDAVIVDEAQDFSDEYWFGVETLLKDPREGTFYLFTDQNQAIYRRDAQLPIEDAPYHLTENCRNTAPIHALAYGFYFGTPVDASELAGPEVETVRLETNAEQAAEIERRVRRLLTEEKVPPSDIVVLLAKRPKQALYDLLSGHRLPGGVDWSFERRVPGTILVDTVARFKGLESAVVMLWPGDEVASAEQGEMVYVGTSRAKYLMHVVGTAKACAAILTRPKVAS